MALEKTSEIVVGDSTIKIMNVGGQDYICLTDMVKNYGGDQAIYQWMRNRNTFEFLGVWERLSNPNFKGFEFETFKTQVGLNSFAMTPKKWITATAAIGMVSKAGRGGGTYAHRDIAFEFGSWLSAEFKLLIIKEFQRLKEKESELEQWDYRRFLTKVNYRLQTSAIQEVLIPLSALPEKKRGIVYATEADVVNVALFGITSREWRKANPKLAKKGNIRDHATVEQLTVLSNLESMNSMYISEHMGKQERFEKLYNESRRQLDTFLASRNSLLPSPLNTKIQFLDRSKPE